MSSSRSAGQQQEDVEETGRAMTLMRLSCVLVASPVSAEAKWSEFSNQEIQSMLERTTVLLKGPLGWRNTCIQERNELLG